MSNIYHYVYRITNIVEMKHYYGKRSSNIEPKLDIGKKYFSSSTDKIFREDQKLNPQNYKYKVIGLFKSAKEAIARESKLHYLFDVALNPKFYNKVKQTLSGFDCTGVPLSKEHGIKIGLSNSRRLITEETRRKMSINRRGKKLTEEHKENLKKSKSNKNFKIYACPHCNKTGGKSYMHKWHFDNCIYSENNDSIIQF